MSDVGEPRGFPGERLHPIDLAADIARQSALHIRNLEQQVEYLHELVKENRERELTAGRDAAVRSARTQSDVERMERLEAENQELRRQLEQERTRELERLRAEVADLRGGPTARRPAATAPEREQSPHLGLGAGTPTHALPAYLFSSYATILGLLRQADAAAQLGKGAEAAEVRFRAADEACAALWKLASDEDYFAQVGRVSRLAAEHADEVVAVIEDDDRFEDVRSASLQLLVLAGLPVANAGELVDGCRADFLDDRVDLWRQPGINRRNVRRLRNALCGQAKAEFRRAAGRSQAKEQAVSSLVKGTGAAAVGALALPLTGLVGPLAAGVLAAMGTAGIDAAASLAKRS